MCAQVFSLELGKDAASHPNELCAFEEYATLWLWAYPELLDWEHQITWLFSPVTGKDKYPGDLWGVDSEGNLLLVETKLATIKKKQDPFLDFIDFEQNSSSPTKTDLTSRHRTLLTYEKHFLLKNAAFLSNGTLQKSRYRGVVPYSSNRSVVSKWTNLYLNVIAPQFTDARSYLERAEKLLSKYPEKGRFIQYIGLVFLNNRKDDGLSNAGKNSHSKLREVAGNDRVHVVTLHAEYIFPDKVLLESHRR